MKLTWSNASADNPGYSVWHATPKRDPNVLYVIRQKKKAPGFTPVGWRVFVRNTKAEPLKTIFMDKKLATCKTFVADLEKTIVDATG